MEEWFSSDTAKLDKISELTEELEAKSKETKLNELKVA